MIRRPPITTRTDTLCPYTTLFRSGRAGGLAAAGARLVSGFDLVADEVELYDRIEGADLVLTAEGFLDAQSFDGKVVGGVVDLAAAAGTALVAIAGDVYDEVGDRIEAVSLVDRFGERLEEHTSELQSLMRISYAVFCLK